MGTELVEIVKKLNIQNIVRMYENEIITCIIRNNKYIVKEDYVGE